MPVTATPSSEPPGAARAEVLSGRDRFLRACHCQVVDLPPVWLMRQAGRALPEYRQLKEKHSFLELVQTPELAAEVTLQPIRRFGFDAAILFSDILVVPEGLGQPYQFQEAGGIRMEFPIRSAADVVRLSSERLVEKLQYVPQTLRRLKTELKDQTALLGFSGSPWTLACFMLEGGSAKNLSRARDLFQNDRKLFDLLCEKLTEAVTVYLRMQIEAGADAVQIFDSLGGLLPPADFHKASERWITQIIAALKGRAVSPAPRNQSGPPPTLTRPSAFAEATADKSDTLSHPMGEDRREGGPHPASAGRPTDVPVIVFAKGVNSSWNDLIGTGANVLGVNHAISLREVRLALPDNIGIQGNLDPALLTMTPEKVAAETSRLLAEMRDRHGYIFNLGHGVPPDAKLENITALVETVRKSA